MNEGELIDSIEAVSGALLQPHGSSPPLSATGDIHAAEVSASIRMVSDAVRTILPVDGRVEAGPDISLLRRAIHETAAVVVRHTPLLLTDVPAPSVSSLIGRAFDENLHSDFLASLLSTERSGDFASTLLDAILSGVGVERTGPTSALQFACRELRLDELDASLEGTIVGARRIDVLVKAVDCVVAIENKVFTAESHNQTRDYAAAVMGRYQDGRAIHLILLSPSGMRAQDRAFRALSYRRLYEALLAAQEQCRPHRYAEPVLETYMACLTSDFIHPEERALRASLADLKEGGYEF